MSVLFGTEVLASTQDPICNALCSTGTPDSSAMESSFAFAGACMPHDTFDSCSRGEAYSLTAHILHILL